MFYVFSVHIWSKSLSPCYKHVPWNAFQTHPYDVWVLWKFSWWLLIKPSNSKVLTSHSFREMLMKLTTYWNLTLYLLKHDSESEGSNLYPVIHSLISTLTIGFGFFILAAYVCFHGNSNSGSFDWKIALWGKLPKEKTNNPCFYLVHGSEYTYV